MKQKQKFSYRQLVTQTADPTVPAVRAACGRLSGWVGIACNLLLCACKLLAGTLSGSVAVSADAFNNLSDASASVVSLIGFKLSSRPADRGHPYGHGRYEYLAGLTVAVLVAAIGVELFLSSFRKILAPTEVEFSLLTGLILAGSILVKLGMMLFNRRMGRFIHSPALLATAADSRNDAISTAAVLLSSLIAQFAGWDLDGYIGLAVAAFILVSSVGLIKKALDPMLGSAPDPEFVESVHQRILSHPGVLGAHDLLVHDYGPGRQFASVHIELPANSRLRDSHEIADALEREFAAEGLHLIVHMDPIEESPAGNDLYTWLTEEVRKVDPALTIHDLRVIKGRAHTDLIFDCAAPAGLSMTDGEIKEGIAARVAAAHPDFRCGITVDRGFAPVNR